MLFRSIGILVPELGDGYHTEVMSGIGDQLIKSGYFYFTAHHRHQKSLVEEYTRMFIGRGAQGIIAVDTLLEHPISVPVVAVAGHTKSRESPTLSSITLSPRSLLSTISMPSGTATSPSCADRPSAPTQTIVGKGWWRLRRDWVSR